MVGLGLCCLMPFATIFQLYRDGQLYWWTKPEDPEKTSNLLPVSCNNVAPVTNLCLGRATMRSYSSQWSKKKVAVET